MQRAHAKLRKVFEPDRESHGKYQRLFAIYRELYPRLQDLFPRLLPESPNAEIAKNVHV